MPTASQCLILMTDDWCDQRLSMRRYSGVNANVSRPNNVIAKVPESQMYNDHPSQNNLLQSRFTGYTSSEPTYHPYQMTVNGNKGLVPYEVSGNPYKRQIYTEDLDHTNQSRKQSSANFEDTRNVSMPHITTLPHITTSTVQTTEDIKASKLDSISGKYGLDEKSYERLENLGFRRRQRRRPDSPKKLDINDNKLLTGKLKDANFVPTPPGHKPISINSLKTLYQDKSGGDISSTETNSGYICVQNNSPPKALSLLEEVKQKVDYDNRVLPAMHMRKALPESNPTALCFSICNSDMLHKDLKDMIQLQTGFDVKSIRYDPVSVRSGSETGSRWIVTFKSREICDQVIRGGLELNGQKVVLKSLNDIHLFEHSAYLAKCEEDKNKALRSKSFKGSPNGKRRDQRRVT